MDDEDLPEAAFEGEWFKWRCPECEFISESDIDQRGSEVECEECNNHSYLPAA